MSDRVSRIRRLRLQSSRPVEIAIAASAVTLVVVSTVTAWPAGGPLRSELGAPTPPAEMVATFDGLLPV